MKNSILEVKIHVAVPREATYDQVVKWLKYGTGYTSEIELENPLCDESMVALSFEVVR